MPKMVLLAQHVSIAATVLNEWVNKAELSIEVEDKDVTTYSSLGWKVVLGGLKSGELAVEFKTDYAAAALDAIMWPLLGTVVPFLTRADQAAIGTSNPQYNGSVLINSWTPIQGGVGDDATAKGSYPTSGAVTRTTS